MSAVLPSQIDIIKTYATNLIKSRGITYYSTPTAGKDDKYHILYVVYHEYLKDTTKPTQLTKQYYVGSLSVSTLSDIQIDPVHTTSQNEEGEDITSTTYNLTLKAEDDYANPDSHTNARLLWFERKMDLADVYTLVISYVNTLLHPSTTS